VGNIDSHQNVFVNINTPLLSNTAGRAAVVAGTQDVNLIRPYLGFAGITQSENSENAHYNGLQANFRIQASHGLSFQAAWTLSKTMSYGQTGDLGTASDPYNLKYDYGLSPFDRKSILMVNFVYDLPFFAHTSNKAEKGLLGGWQISGIVTSETGLALTPTYNNTSLGLGGGGNHPDLTGSVSYANTYSDWFSPSAFSAPAPLAFGSATAGCLRGPGLNNLDASVFKNFRGIPWFTKEGATLQIRFESFNTLNHTEFNGVNLNYSSLSNFGQISSVYPARALQLGARFTF
jgi:hypothetical protein